MPEDKQLRKLREKLEGALAKRKDDDAIKLLGQLMEADAKNPRWPHKRGELYRKRNRKEDAIRCYGQAADLYLDQGFLARAVAMAKTVIDIDPMRLEVLERIDPEAARKLHRQQRPASISARPPAHPAVIPEGSNPAPRRHPALLDEDDAGPTEHPAVILESDSPPARHPAVLPEDDAGGASFPPEADAGLRARGPSRRDVARARQRHASTTEQDLERDRAAYAEAANVPGPPPLPQFPASLMDLADELTIAPDVQPNETRFSNQPESAAIRPSLTDRELEPRKPAEPRHSTRPKHPGARTLSNLPLFPLFAELPHEALVEMVKGAEVIDLDDGAAVVRKGDPADALYGIVEGSVDVVVPGQTLRMTLAEGDVFGESCLLAGEKRHADVIVRGHLSALRIPKHVFTRVLAAYPRLAELLLELLTRRLLGNLLQSSPMFQEFDARGRQELAQLFEIRRAPRGMVLAEIGKKMDGLYISLTGTLEVSYGADHPIELHEAGTMFGQSCLLGQAVSDVGVRTQNHMLVLRLPARAFHSIAMQYPGMLAQISELSGSNVAKITT